MNFSQQNLIPNELFMALILSKKIKNPYFDEKKYIKKLSFNETNAVQLGY